MLMRRGITRSERSGPMIEQRAAYTPPCRRCLHATRLLERVRTVHGEIVRQTVVVYSPCEESGLPCPWCSMPYCDAHQAEHLTQCVAKIALVAL